MLDVDIDLYSNVVAFSSALFSYTSPNFDNHPLS
jgi:hypothetical protein